MSKDAKLAFEQSIGLMFVTTMLMAVGYVIGFVNGILWCDDVNVNEKIKAKESKK